MIKKLPLSLKIQYFKVAIGVLLFHLEIPTDTQLLFLPILRSGRPMVVFLQVTFLMKMDFESINYIKSVALCQLSYPVIDKGRNRTCAFGCCSNRLNYSDVYRKWDSNP